LNVTGKGVPRNDALAYMWFEVAQAHGSAKAQQAKDLLLQTISRLDLNEGRRMAAGWTPVE
jgi:TPR repeat protein